MHYKGDKLRFNVTAGGTNKLPAPNYTGRASGGSVNASPGGSTSDRQSGHVACDASHMSMHSTWYRCLHRGNRRTISPACTVPRHTEHCAPSPLPLRLDD